MRRRRLVWVTLAGASLLLPAAASPEGDKPTVKGGTLVWNNLPDLEGKKVSSSDKRFAGKVLLVDVFGTWCPPCRAETPYLVELYKKHKTKGLEIVGISFEREESETKRLEMVKNFAKKHGIEYTVLLGGSTGSVDEVFNNQIENFRAFPTAIFIGRDGKVADIEVGFPTGSNEEAREAQKKVAAGFEKRIQELLDKKGK